MPTDDELRRDAEHLDYEVWMLSEIADRFRGVRPLPDDEVARRALLEAWLLHVRLLMEVFGNRRGPDGDNVQAVHFVQGDAAERSIRALEIKKDSPEDRRLKQIHKCLAHLAQDRSRLCTDWTEADLQMVASRLRVFFDVLAPERRLWFPRASLSFPAQLPSERMERESSP